MSYAVRVPEVMVYDGIHTGDDLDHDLLAQARLDVDRRAVKGWAQPGKHISEPILRDHVVLAEGCHTFTILFSPRGVTVEVPRNHPPQSWHWYRGYDRCAATWTPRAWY